MHSKKASSWGIRRLFTEHDPEYVA
jgi:hypothetical protein